MSVTESLRLPNGVVLRNRIVKAALSEYLGDAGSNEPGQELIGLYERWGRSGAAMLITGNIIVTRQHLEAPTNVAVEKSDGNSAALAAWAASVGPPTLLVAQVSHPGRQCPISVSASPVAPSAVPLKLFPSAFVPPAALSTAQIHEIVQRFADTADVLHNAGFSGIQLHAAHGYLLSTFLSPLTNVRTDAYGGSLQNRMRILLEIIAAVQKKLSGSPRFILSVKLNSSDFQRGGFSEDDALNVCLALEKAGVDFVELSGGNYENAGQVFMRQQSTVEREGFFFDFAARIKKSLSRMRVMLTGGFRTLEGMNLALAQDATDLIGIGRPFCVEPLEKLQQLTSGKSVGRLQSPDTDAFDNRGWMRSLNSGIQAIWYSQQFGLLARGASANMELSSIYCLLLSVPKYFFHPRRWNRGWVVVLIAFLIGILAGLP